MTSREERIARNEALFREVNERVKVVREETGEPERRMRILCECGDEDCVAEIEISRDEYEQVRADSRQFVVTPGHITPDVESVVGEREGYEIARKYPAEAEIANRTDPRG
jgi:hypothetical protein